MIYSIADISRKLSEQTEAVCRHLLPTGKRHGGTWEVGGVNGETGKSLKVNIEGQFPGTWKDWADDDFRGDLVDLWEKVKGLSKLEAIAEIKKYLDIKPSAMSEAKRYALPVPKNSIAKIKPLSKAESYLVLDRKLKEETLEAFKVKCDGKNVVYESWSPTGKLLNRCYVSLTRDEQGRKRVTQEAKCAPSLFGWQALDKSAFDQRSVLICEGQIDAMTWHQWGFSALSVPNGSGTTWIEYEWENLEAFETIYLSFDMDGKTDGPLQKTIQRLGLHRCRIVNLPYKDANDCLKADCTKEDALEWITQAKWPTFKGLVEAEEYYAETLEELFPSKKESEIAICVSFLQRNDGGIKFYPSDVTVWTGISGHGKTTFLNFLTSLLVLANEPVFIASLEMMIPVLLGRIVKAMSGKQNPTEQETREIFNLLQGKLVFVPRVGSIKKEDLFESMQYAFARYGCTHYIVDSFMRIEGMEEDYPAQGQFMNEVQDFVKNRALGTHVHLVCHPRKLNDTERPGKMDVKGSSLIPNNADNIISLRRNHEKMEKLKQGPLSPQENEGMWDLMVSSEKQRRTGWEGAICLRFHPHTFTYSKFNGK